jgi:UDP-glucose 4-epimerase
MTNLADNSKRAWKRVVVTGGAGFIGSHVADLFAQQGYDVTILDNLSTGHLNNLQSRWTFCEADVCKAEDVSGILKGADCVVHLAAFTSVPDSFECFQECYHTNVEGTYNVLEACVEHDVHKLVFASSSAVYAELPDAPKSEDDCPEPISPYAVSKLEGEHLLRLFQKKHGLATVAFRFFNVYGPRQAADSAYAAAVPIFMQKSIQQQSFTIYGDGQQTRDFVFVRDVAKAIYQATISETTGVFNVGTGRAIEIIELARTITQLCEVDFEPVFEPLRPGDVRSSTADVTKIQRALTWTPAHSLEQGLLDTFEWYKNQETTQT